MRKKTRKENNATNEGICLGLSKFETDRIAQHDRSFRGIDRRLRLNVDRSRHRSQVEEVLDMMCIVTSQPIGGRRRAND